jgi:hypothetical protein
MPTRAEKKFLAISYNFHITRFYVQYSLINVRFLSIMRTYDTLISTTYVCILTPYL